MRSLATSLVVHGLLALVLLLARRDPASPPRDRPVTFDLAALPGDLDDRSGAGEGAAGEPAAGPPRPRPKPATPTPAPAPPPQQPPTPTLGSVTGGPLHLAPPGTGGEGGAGIGGRGRGSGPGLGHRGAGHSSAKPARPEPRRSKARPPKLIYPKRYRPDRPGEVFVVLLTIDTEGYVDGVRLIRGVNPHDDAKALDAVWRFRYAPALDDRGRPRRARVRQRFMLER